MYLLLCNRPIQHIFEKTHEEGEMLKDGIDFDTFNRIVLGELKLGAVQHTMEAKLEDLED